jgi:hypothetical protein
VERLLAEVDRIASAGVIKLDELTIHVHQGRLWGVKEVPEKWKQEEESLKVRRWSMRSELSLFSILCFEFKVEKKEQLNPDGYFDQMTVFILTAWLHQLYDCSESHPGWRCNGMVPLVPLMAPKWSPEKEEFLFIWMVESAVGQIFLKHWLFEQPVYLYVYEGSEFLSVIIAHSNQSRLLIWD